MISFKSTLSVISRNLVVATLLAAPVASIAGHTTLAVLNFELDEVKSGLQRELLQMRADNLLPMLTMELEETHGVSISHQPEDAVVERIGPVFNRPRATAELGHALNVDWLISCLLQKDEKSFAYLRAQLFEVGRNQITADYVVEVKGDEDADHKQGIVSLADQIADTLRRLQFVH